MKLASIALILVSLFPNLLTLGQISHAELRIEFPKAVKSESACTELIERLNKVQKNDYISIAYRGAANIVMAKFLTAPNKRLKYFMAGKDDLESAIEKMPKNVELRYLRFTIQQHAPSMLFYDDQEEDLAFILDHLMDVKEPEYREKIKDFLRNSGKCTEDQLAILNR